MKKSILVLAISIGVGLSYASPSFALNMLQLDIADGWYDTTTETIIASDSVFTLYALLTPKENASAVDIEALLADTYYVSAALLPKTDVAGSFGSFTFNGVEIEVTKDMAYGAPPLADIDGGESDSGDLQPHDVFDTYYTEFSFKFDALNTTTPYNSEELPGGIDTSGSGAYYAAFTVNVSNLSYPNIVHFDLYNTEVFLTAQGQNPVDDIDTDDFAPFSHDAQSSPVPEPGTMLLFGTGLAGLAAVGRRRKN